MIYDEILAISTLRNACRRARHKIQYMIDHGEWYSPEGIVEDLDNVLESTEHLVVKSSKGTDQWMEFEQQLKSHDWYWQLKSMHTDGYDKSKCSEAIITDKLVELVDVDRPRAIKLYQKYCPYDYVNSKGYINSYIDRLVEAKS
jgi:hypothetical protein